MKNSVEVEINQSYIELVGDVIIDSSGNSKWDETEPYAQRMREQVFDTNVIDEFDHGWRSEFNLEVTEEEAEEFTRCCVGILGNSIKIDDFRMLVQPIQLPMAKKYKKEHIEALVDAPIEYRKRQAHNLSPLFEACSDVLSVKDIISLLVEGVIDNVKPLGSHPSAGTVVSKLEETIEDHEGDIDLSNDYFYQGPRHLGILPTGKESKIAGCACEYSGGYIYPFFFSDKDPVNKEAMEVLDYVD